MNHLFSKKLIQKFATPLFVLSQFHFLQFSPSYFEMQDDKDKQKSKLNKVAKKAWRQLKGVIASIESENRDWKDLLHQWEALFCCNWSRIYVDLIF